MILDYKEKREKDGAGRGSKPRRWVTRTGAGAGEGRARSARAGGVVVRPEVPKGRPDPVTSQNGKTEGAKIAVKGQAGHVAESLPYDHERSASQ